MGNRQERQRPPACGGQGGGSHAPVANVPDRAGVYAVIALCVGILLLVLLRGHLSTNQFAQRVAALLLALLIAVVIFAFIPAPTTVKLRVSVGRLQGSSSSSCLRLRTSSRPRWISKGRLPTVEAPSEC